MVIPHTAGKSAMRFNVLLREMPRFPDRDLQSELLSMMVQHINAIDRAGMKLLPKHHLMIHMILRVRTLGKPKLYSTYFGETTNGVVASVSRSVHVLTFCASVHRKYGALLHLSECPDPPAQR